MASLRAFSPNCSTSIRMNIILAGAHHKIHIMNNKMMHKCTDRSERKRDCVRMKRPIEIRKIIAVCLLEVVQARLIRKMPHYERFVLIKLWLRKFEKATHCLIQSHQVCYSEQRNLSESPRRARIDQRGNVRVVPVSC